MAARYTVESTAKIALVAATAKTVLSYINGSGKTCKVIEMSVSFDGVTATAVPVEVELCSSTEATAGTATSHTMQQTGGPTRTPDGTAKRNFSAEPTVLTILKSWLVPAFNGTFVLQYPLGREPEQNVTADALVIRCTAPAAVNLRGYLEIEEG